MLRCQQLPCLHPATKLALPHPVAVRYRHRNLKVLSLLAARRRASAER
jgi:hypothetical protein